MGTGEGRKRLAHHVYLPWSHRCVDDLWPSVVPCPWRLHPHLPGGPEGHLSKQSHGWLAHLWKQKYGLMHPTLHQNTWDCLPLGYPHLKADAGARQLVRLNGQLLGTLLPSAFGGGSPRPLLASVYLSVEYSCMGKNSYNQAGLSQSFLPPRHSPQRLQPWLASAVDFLRGKSCLGPEVAPRPPCGASSFFVAASDDMYPQLGVAFPHTWRRGPL